MPRLVEIGSLVLERKILNVVILFLLFPNYLTFRKSVALHLNKLESSYHSDDFVPSLLEIGLVVLEKKIFKSCQCISIISQWSLLWEERGPSLQQTWIPLTQGYFVPSLLEIGPVVLERKIFKSCQFIFIISQLTLLWEGCGPSLQQTWIPSTRMLCAKFCWNWPSGSFLNEFLLYPNYLPFEKCVALHLNKFESPSPKNAGPVVLVKKILKVFNVFLLFQNYLPLKKGLALHAKKLDFFFQPRMLCAKIGWNCFSGFGEENF